MAAQIQEWQSLMTKPRRQIFGLPVGTANRRQFARPGRASGYDILANWQMTLSQRGLVFDASAEGGKVLEELQPKANSMTRRLNLAQIAYAAGILWAIW